MTNTQTAKTIRDWCNAPSRDFWSWPTDPCGYDQHMKFVAHRNKNWTGEGDLRDFCLNYIKILEAEDE